MKAAINHRHVFYLSGFDPRGASFYHRVFKEEAQKQSCINGIKVDVQARKKHSDIAQIWRVQADHAGHKVTTDYEFLRWDDIIRNNWVKSLLSIFIDFIYVSWVYITSGTLKRVAKTSRTPTITGLYPAVYIALSGFVALLLCFLSIALFSAFNIAWLGWLLGVGLFVAFIYAAKIWGDKINVFWLLRIYGFTSRWAVGAVPSLDQRIDVFAERVFRVLTEGEQDEVVLVSHSVGTMLAVAVAARVMEKLDREQVQITLNMMTLGECIPLLSLLPKAAAIRKDLAYLSRAEKLFWVDYTSPADGACFPLVDPLKVSLSTVEHVNSPLLLSARFHTLFTPEHYQKIRRNFYNMHFLYLMANDVLGQYDYFALTLGKQTLMERIEQYYGESVLKHNKKAH